MRKLTGLQARLPASLVKVRLREELSPRMPNRSNRSHAFIDLRAETGWWRLVDLGRRFTAKGCMLRVGDWPAPCGKGSAWCSQIA